MKSALSLICIAVFAFINGKTEFRDDGYSFIKEGKNVRLFYRNVTLPNGEYTRELKAECIVRGIKHSILEHLKSQEHLKLWMQNIKNVNVLKDEDSKNWYTYIHYGLPWPLNDQDCILKFSLIENYNGYHILYYAVPDYSKKENDVDRINIMQGKWDIRSLPNGYCKVEYTVATERNINFPRWAADPFVHRNLIESINSLKCRVESKGIE